MTTAALPQAQPLPRALEPVHSGFVHTFEDTEGFHQCCKINEGIAQLISQMLVASEHAMPGMALGRLGHAIGTARRMLQMRYIFGSIDGVLTTSKKMNSPMDPDQPPVDRRALQLDLATSLGYTAYGITDTAVWLEEIGAISLGEHSAAMGTANGVLFCLAVAGEIACDAHQLRKETALAARLRDALEEADQAVLRVQGLATQVMERLNEFEARTVRERNALKEQLGGAWAIRNLQARLNDRSRPHGVSAVVEGNLARYRELCRLVPEHGAVSRLDNKLTEAGEAMALARLNPMNAPSWAVEEDGAMQAAWRQLRVQRNLNAALNSVERDRRLLGINIFKNILLIMGMIGAMVACRNKTYFAVLTGVSGAAGFYRIWSGGYLGAIRKRHDATERMLAA
jgi:hypothetical protein